MIPPKVRLIGDEEKAKRLSAFAQSQLEILHNSMKFQKLKQDIRRLRFEDGSYIVVNSSFGLDTIDIYVPPAVEEPVPEKVRVEEEHFLGIEGGVFRVHGGPVEAVPCSGIPALVWEEGNPTELGRLGVMQFTVRGGVPALDLVKLIGVDARYFWVLEGGSGYWFNETFTETEQTSVVNIPGSCAGASGLDQIECEANGGVWTFAGSRVLVYTDQWICDPVVLKVTDVCSNRNDTEIEMDITAMDDLAWVSSFGPQLPCRRNINLPLEIEYGKPPFTFTSGSSQVGFVPIVENCLGKTAVLESSQRVVGLCIDGLGCGQTVEIKVEDSCSGEETMDITAIMAEVALDWDDDESDDTIDASSEATVCIKHGKPPYKWSASSGDFFFLAEETTLPCNTLYATAAACGMATVTVVDCCGEVTTGSVRCTTGEWTYEGRKGGDTCVPWCSIAPGVGDFDLIVGNGKWEMYLVGNISCCDNGACPDPAPCDWLVVAGDPPLPPCGDACECCVYAGCNTCGGSSKSIWAYYNYYTWGC